MGHDPQLDGRSAELVSGKFGVEPCSRQQVRANATSRFRGRSFGGNPDGQLPGSEIRARVLWFGPDVPRCPPWFERSVYLRVNWFQPAPSSRGGSLAHGNSVRSEIPGMVCPADLCAMAKRRRKHQRCASYQPGLAAQDQVHGEIMRAEGPAHRLGRFCPPSRLHPEGTPSGKAVTCKMYG